MAQAQHSNKKSARERIVVALDVETADQALILVEKLRGTVGMFKVGKQLFTAAGPDIVRRIIEMGEKVFLDLKFHDIPNTVAMAGVEAMRLGASIFNIHALGGSKMMRATVDAVNQTAEREGLAKPIILGVTVLTSHDQSSLSDLGINRSVEEQVVQLAKLCAANGINGVVASPKEIKSIREAISDPDFVILTPGVRPLGADLNDQSRVMTPAEAVQFGATYLVIGRPITGAKDVVEAAKKIIEEIEQVGA
ncbi:MAG TPA: orotidine-5'-phosphate decarboxylase [Blastocatellia bacterium]|nr:orotidine-5'-phosphate decarboxylase [Blastocatellia bacterium]